MDDPGHRVQLSCVGRGREDQRPLAFVSGSSDLAGDGLRDMFEVFELRGDGVRLPDMQSVPVDSRSYQFRPGVLDVPRQLNHFMIYIF